MKGTAYLLQATLISLWWIGLLINKEFYNAFQYPGISSIAFNSFLLPDLFVIALLSGIRAYKSYQGLDYIILGGFAFATLYTINATLLTGGGILSTTVMTLGLCYNLFLVYEQRMFRKSKTKHIGKNALKTLIQVICIWVITLFVFPELIMNSFGEVASVDRHETVGIFIFLLFSSIGLYSAYTMVVKGEGTPLPLDQTHQLVLTGPYKYIRNPMALAGVGQGISVSIFYGSIPVFVYALIGAILWQFVVRPIEEKDMRLRFGKPYETYRNKVRCWIPKMNIFSK